MKNLITALFVVSAFLICPNTFQAQDDTSSRLFDYKIPEECRIDERPGRVAYQISRPCAIECIAKYESFIETVDGGGVNLIRGVEINRSELKRIVDRSVPSDRIFVMLGIMPDESTGAIFMVKPRNVSNSRNRMEDDDGSTFFDFTAPCPTTCPWE